jgi:hypothetical protein
MKSLSFKDLNRRKNDLVEKLKCNPDYIQLQKVEGAMSLVSEIGQTMQDEKSTVGVPLSDKELYLTAIDDYFHTYGHSPVTTATLVEYLAANDMTITGERPTSSLTNMLRTQKDKYQYDKRSKMWSPVSEHHGPYQA